MRKIRLPAGVFGAVAVGLLALAASLYLSGMVSVLGNVAEHQKSKFFITERYPGFTWGLRTLWLNQGWEIYVDYEVDAKAGSLRLALMETFAPIGKMTHDYQHIIGQQAGRVTFQAPHSGFFTFNYSCSPLHGPARHKGYCIDVDYSLTWGLLTH
jgi:hypothetical protein